MSALDPQKACDGRVLVTDQIDLDSKDCPVKLAAEVSILNLFPDPEAARASMMFGWSSTLLPRPMLNTSILVWKYVPEGRG